MRMAVMSGQSLENLQGPQVLLLPQWYSCLAHMYPNFHRNKCFFDSFIGVCSSLTVETRTMGIDGLGAG